MDGKVASHTVVIVENDQNKKTHILEATPCIDFVQLLLSITMVTVGAQVNKEMKNHFKYKDICILIFLNLNFTKI